MVQAVLGLAVLLVLWLAANWVYQVLRKPSELFFPVSGVLYRTPTETWSTYGRIFRKHSTPVMAPDLLAALAQVEGSGNPIVRTYWRWTWTTHPFEIYRPASSAVGMYQLTDGTFEQARRYCIHDHQVTVDGPWYAWRSCWLNALYARVVPTHAAEMTAAYLDLAVNDILARQRRGATLAQRQRLATVTHLCGAGAGATYARRAFSQAPGQKCGDHDVRVYVARVENMRKVFRELAARE